MLGQLFSKMHELAILKAIKGWHQKLRAHNFAKSNLITALQKNQAVLRLLNSTLVKWTEQGIARMVRHWWKQMVQADAINQVAAKEAECQVMVAGAEEKLKASKEGATEERDRLLIRLEEQELNSMLSALATAFRKLGWLFRVWMQNSVVCKYQALWFALIDNCSRLVACLQ